MKTYGKIVQEDCINFPGIFLPAIAGAFMYCAGTLQEQQHTFTAQINLRDFSRELR